MRFCPASLSLLFLRYLDSLVLSVPWVLYTIPSLFSGASNLLFRMRHGDRRYDPNAPVQIDDSGRAHRHNVYMTAPSSLRSKAFVNFVVDHRVPLVYFLSVRTTLSLRAATQRTRSSRPSPAESSAFPPELSSIDMADCCNTGSSTSAIALRPGDGRGARSAPARVVMLVGLRSRLLLGRPVLELI